MDKTVVKALNALEYICEVGEPVGVTELAKKFQLVKSNAHRVLTTLTALGYLRKQGDAKYSATLKVWELGTLIVSRLDLVKIARPYLDELNRITDEAVYLATLDGENVVYLAVLESRHPIKIYARVGGSAPIHCSASGKVLLTFNDQVRSKVLRRTLISFTKKTPTNAADLEKVLDTVRRQGFSTNDGDWIEGVSGVAAPIHSRERLGVAAIGVTGPSQRMHRKTFKHLSSIVVPMAQRISRELGYRPG